MTKINFLNEGAPIGYYDVQRSVSLNIETWPQGNMLREIFQNGAEASRHPDETARQIWIRSRLWEGMETPKLSFLNTGIGMDFEEILAMSNLMRSSKATGHTQRLNRGEGMKIASLRFNPLGIVITSRKDGITHQSKIGLFNGRWGRQIVEIDGQRDEAWEYEIPAEFASYYPATDDFTEVVLLGVRPDHDTFQDPYGTGKLDRNTVLKELQSRYYTYPKVPAVDLPSRVYYQPDHDRVGLVDGDEVRFAGQLFDEQPEDFTHITHVVLGDDVVAEFVYTDPELHVKPLSAPTLALVWRGEKYDVFTGPPWGNRALNFGIVGIAKRTSLYIHIADDADVRDNRHRSGIEVNGRAVGCDDFKDDIVWNLPEWAAQIIAKLRDSQSSNFDSQGDLQRWVSEQEARRERGSEHGQSGRGSTGSTTRRSQTTTRRPRSAEAAPSEREIDTAVPHAGGRARLTAPDLIWIRDIANEPALTDRIAFFARTARSSTIFLNGTAPEIDAMAEEVYAGLATNQREEVLPIVREAVEHQISLSLGRTVFKLRSLIGTRGWVQDDVNRGLERESLQAIAMTVMINDVATVIQRVKSLQAFKLIQKHHRASTQKAAATATAKPVRRRTRATTASVAAPTADPQAVPVKRPRGRPRKTPAAASA